MLALALSRRLGETSPGSGPVAFDAQRWVRAPRIAVGRPHRGCSSQEETFGPGVVAVDFTLGKVRGRTPLPHGPPVGSSLDRRSVGTVLGAVRRGAVYLARMADVEAHITGTVWKIECEVGDTIAEGDTVVILESMKMEMPVEAEDEGTVKEILCEEGQAVNEGDTLVVLE